MKTNETEDKIELIDADGGGQIENFKLSSYRQRFSRRKYRINRRPKYFHL